MVRLHTEKGTEFVNRAVQDMMIGAASLGTNTGGYDPKANGRAEMYIGIIKQKATSYTVHSKMPLTVWYWECTHVAYILRCKALKPSCL